ncbi:unnamed protein product, partial [Choristocarpus tenellus]
MFEYSSSDSSSDVAYLLNKADPMDNRNISSGSSGNGHFVAPHGRDLCHQDIGLWTSPSVHRAIASGSPSLSTYLNNTSPLEAGYFPSSSRAANGGAPSSPSVSMTGVSYTRSSSAAVAAVAAAAAAAANGGKMRGRVAPVIDVGLPGVGMRGAKGCEGKEVGKKVQKEEGGGGYL